MTPLRMPVSPGGLRIVADWVPCGLCGEQMLYTRRGNYMSLPVCGPCLCNLLAALKTHTQKGTAP